MLKVEKVTNLPHIDGNYCVNPVPLWRRKFFVGTESELHYLKIPSLGPQGGRGEGTGSLCGILNISTSLYHLLFTITSLLNFSVFGSF
jgi:hypothetical protein